jgi:glycosyltransferase involved in cell wall biosynthesis
VAVLRVIVDNILAPDPSGVNRYAREITKALVRTAPRDCTVVGVCAEHDPEHLADLRQQVPGLADLIVLPATSAQLGFGWSTGLPPRMLPAGLTHSPTLLAPFFRHDRTKTPVDQVVATLHSTALWTAPETLSRREAFVFARTIRRAERYADAVVVTNHTVAEALDEHTTLGERVHLIPAAPTHALTARGPVAQRAAEYGLPERFLLTFASEPTANLELLLAAYDRAGRPEPLIVVGAQNQGEAPLSGLLAAHGLYAPDVQVLGVIDDDMLAVTLTRATALLDLGTSDMVGLSLLDAMAARTPVITSADRVQTELTGGAGLTVSLTSSSAVDRLRQSIVEVTSEAKVRNRLKQEGGDWVKQFSWQQSARQIWALHADL